MNSTEMRVIFDNSQHFHKHNKCLKQMQDLYQKSSSSVELMDAFKAELRRDILFTLNCEPKSPFTKHSIEFIAKFLKSLSNPSMDSNGTESATNSQPKDTSGDTTIIYDQMLANGEDESANNRSDQENRNPINNESDCEDEIGMESFGSQSFNHKNESTVSAANTSVVKEEPTFADIIISEHLIRFLQNIKTDIRLNSCILIRKLFTDLEDMDLDVYQKLKKALLDRLRDKDKEIRSAAALALHRFQEVEGGVDLVGDGLKFHLNHDPDFRVRQSCLLSLQPRVELIDEFINATRDVKDIIRKTAFTLIADKFNVKNIGIDKRLQILRNGLNERHSAVKKVVETKLLPNWVKTYDSDFEALLYGLDIQSDPELIERMLFLYFDHLNKDMDETTETTVFHKFLDEFRNTFFERNNLLTKVMVTVENSFLWRIVAKYCKDKDIVITSVIQDNNETNTEEMAETDSQPMEPIVAKEDAIDKIVPDLPHFCRYINIFIDNLLANEYDLNELMEFEFMFTQLLSLGELIDIGDDAQRQILHKCVTDLLSNERLFRRIHKFIPHLMKIFAQNSELNAFMRTSFEIIDKINSKAIEAIEEDEPPVPSQPEPSVSEEVLAEQLRQYEMEYAKLMVRIESLKDDLESALNNNSESEAKRIQDLIEELNAKMDDIMQRRLRVNACQLGQSSQQSTQCSQKDKIQKTLTDDPLDLEQCLQIFCGCIEFGDIKAMNPFILQLIDKMIKPSIPNPENKIRSLAVNGLGLCCLISSDLAKSYFGLFVQVLNLDSDEAQETALKCVFDILCFHGLSYFEQKSKSKNQNQSKQNRTAFEESLDNKENRNNNSLTKEEREENDDNERTIINTNDLEVLCSDSEQNDSEEEESEESFISLFTDLLEKHLYSESDSIRLITAQGIAKLFILGRMYSPQLLSKLIILWYDPDSTEQMRQFLGVFLPIYSGIQMKANLKGENAFEECFIKTIETVYNERLVFVNLDNLVNFTVELISDDGHKTLIKSVANQILTRMLANGVDDTLSNKYYLRVLSILRLTEMSLNDIKEYKLLIKKIERNINKMKTKTKLTSNRLQTIKTKIDKQIELIKQNTSQLSTIEDFGSLSLSQSLSQSLSERSQIDETIIETNY